MSDSEDSRLPEGWIAVALGDAAHIQLGKMLDRGKTPNGPALPYLRNANVRWRTFDLGDLSEMPFSESESNKFDLRDGDVVVCEGGEPGRAAVWNAGPTNIKFQKALHRIRPEACVAPAWIVFRLEHDAALGKLEKHCTGTTIKHLTAKAIARYRLPLPPLPEQRRIAAKIESLQERSSRARAALAEVGPLLEQFRRSVLSAAFSGRLTADWRAAHPDVEPASELLHRIRTERRHHWEQAELAKYEAKGKKPPRSWRDSYKEPASVDAKGLPKLPASWCWATIDTLASDAARSIQSGPFGSNLLHSEFQSSGILAIGIDNVHRDGFSMGEQHRISESKYEELKKYTARPLDVLVTVMATVGRCCIVPADLEPAIITKHVYRITIDQQLALPQFVVYALQGASTVLSTIAKVELPTKS